jgi:hypothetical protein
MVVDAPCPDITVDLNLVAPERKYERPQPRPLEPGVRMMG